MPLFNPERLNGGVFHYLLKLRFFFEAEYICLNGAEIRFPRKFVTEFFRLKFGFCMRTKVVSMNSTTLRKSLELRFWQKSF